MGSVEDTAYSDKPSYSDNSMLSKVRKVIIQGPGGSGKSMLAANTFLSLAKKGKYVPLLIELRDLNDFDNLDIIDVLHFEFTKYGAKVAREQIEIGLEEGIFILIFDGFDEVSSDRERHYESLLTGAATRFIHTSIVVTSRPSQRFYSWTNFSIASIEPLEELAVVRLVEKLKFDEKTKENFIFEIGNGLFDTHRAFLGIPLLAIVMLLTRSETGIISNVTHQFYQDTFDALWSKHDARKEGFSRRRYSGLDKPSFVKVLSAFAASSYHYTSFSFDEADFEKHFANACVLTNVDCNHEVFLKDLVNSVSFFIRDGTKFRFVHRLFHEYFAALYFLTLDGDDFRFAVDAISNRFEKDTVLNLLFAMNKRFFEDNWVRPTITEFLPKLESARKNPFTYGDIVGAGYSENLNCIRYLYVFSPTARELESRIIQGRKESVNLIAKGVNVEDSRYQFPAMLKDIENFQLLGAEIDSFDEAFAKAQKRVFGNPRLERFHCSLLIQV